MDFGPKVRGYCGDMTRTVALGYVTEEMEKVYNIVLKSQLAGLAAIKAGVKGAYVNKISRDIIVEAGYGEYFPHGTGHCVGKEVHEPPWVSNRKGEEDMILEENHAVTVEPGIYIPKKFSVEVAVASEPDGLGHLAGLGWDHVVDGQAHQGGAESRAEREPYVPADRAGRQGRGICQPAALLTRL